MVQQDYKFKGIRPNINVNIAIEDHIKFWRKDYSLDNMNGKSEHAGWSCWIVYRLLELVDLYGRETGSESIFPCSDFTKKLKIGLKINFIFIFASLISDV